MPLTVWMTTNCGKFLEMGISDYLTYLLRNLYVGQEATFRTRHGTTYWFQIGKGVHLGCVLSPCLFNFCAEYMWHVCEMLGWMKHKLESRLPGEISITSDYCRCADDTLMAESEELKSLLMKVKEESKKAGLNSVFRKLKSWHLVPSFHGK